MSIKANTVDEVLAYVEKRIGEDHSTVLVIFYNTETGENIAAPMGSDQPEGFSVVGSFYWDDTLNDVTFRGVDTD